MNKILKLQSAMLAVIAELEEQEKSTAKHRDEPLDWERLHLASSARLGYLMALERSVDPEFAAMACSLHDFGRIVTGLQEDHAEAGYEPVKRFLQSLDMFTDEETEALATAVRNHSKKSEIGTPVEEIVKDADVVDCYQYGIPFSRDEHRVRYVAYMKKTGER